MLMVIFGAGASYDSAQAFPPLSTLMHEYAGAWRPPLAKDLFLDREREFGDIVTKYPRLTRILPFLRSPSEERSVEQILESLQDQGRDYAERRRELASVRFYLCELLMKVTDAWSLRTNGVTNYAPLIDEILRLDKSGQEVCLVTFNYDLLLERALCTFPEFEMKPPEDFLFSHPKLKVFKLHGSVNWSRTVDTAGKVCSPGEIIEQADKLEPSARFVPVNAALQWGNPYGSVFPAVAIPVQTKTENHFECPLAHREYLAKMLPTITKILIIGWQAKEAHFLQMLRDNLPKLTHAMVVGQHTPDSAEILTYFLRQIGKPGIPNTFYGEGGFTHFIVSQEGDEFLRA